MSCLITRWLCRLETKVYGIESSMVIVGLLDE